ncbi:hypothetical protein GCM10022225_33750 [Plantactinospora mayteni]|uniref:Septum formation-related domain-containing protein n=1 Tax=Plantactinospora mayteni TaxID=566021 RepID=A0ABQ4EM77_9ACTN|nr:hypothetical protein [Plantactinospora mayteni]GIG95461.1 hypothetical protein Pma05_20340 [Plantactinospora mayteni]
MAALLFVLLAGCAEESPRDAGATGAVDDTLRVSDCVAPGGPDATSESWREVACDDAAAVASVISVDVGGLGMAGALAEPDCPAGTDHVVRVIRTQQGSAAGFTFACARNLKPPHPGDPGEGGGPGIVVGDCVSEPRLGPVEETRCDGTGERKPTHRITQMMVGACPPGSDATFTIGGQRSGAPDPSSQRVACAEAL